jgi:hypothetical protein
MIAYACRAARSPTNISATAIPLTCRRRFIQGSFATRVYCCRSPRHGASGRNRPSHPGVPITFELEQEVLAMAALRDVPDVVGQMMAMRTGPEPVSVIAPFRDRNRTAKHSIDAYLM